MSEDYYITLIKDIIENNDKDEAIKIIANKLNEKQISNEKEMLTNLDKDKEIERLNNIINELEKALKDHKQIKTKAHYGEYYVEVEEVLDYLQKLKGESNEKN